MKKESREKENRKRKRQQETKKTAQPGYQQQGHLQESRALRPVPAGQCGYPDFEKCTAGGSPGRKRDDRTVAKMKTISGRTKSAK